MWTKWVIVHQSYGLPRAADEYRRRLKLAGITCKVTGKKRGGALYLYQVQVPIEEKERALSLLAEIKRELQI
ncbi:SPOR domain-containing protein [Brevibacillus daliensis]|uniref:SPOR domain-containing protein n=1 Tax=Brevibacillus daliensis TaxID=2892995 RepID=UPI001E4CD188|nr:SPOR domain-containing protein [Brevibacillus daliensis]